MDQSYKSKFNKFKCSAKINNPKCNRHNLRGMSLRLIDKIHSMGYTHEIDESMSICESCRGLISHNRSPNTKKRRSDGNDETMQPSFSGQQHHDVPEPEPSTSGQQIEHELDMVPSIPSLESIPSTDQLQGPHNIEKFNTIAETLSLSPISSRNMRSMEYRINKSLQITKAVRKNIFGIDSTDVGKVEAYDEIIMQLKDKFNHPTTDRSEQIKILSVLPKSWSVNKITREFNAPMYMARQVKDLVDEQGILCTTEKRRGHGIDDDTKQIVREFFDDNDISRPMPGTNDFVSEVRNGKKQQVQKRLLMMSLKEAYMIFVDMYKTVNIGFTVFTQLRPKHCILLDSTGIHNVCICTIHENVNLMFNSIRIVSQDEIIQKMLCDISTRTDNCFFRACEKCACNEHIEEELTLILESNDKEEIIFQQWLNTDRCNLETIIKPVDEFVPYLVDKIDKLITHDFIHKQQSSFLRNKKDTLKDDEILAICDFSENYSFIIQNAAQGYHWNNSQATHLKFTI
ncbi:uncharacterized protein LOC134287568 [Aedes albopictus]|uniref:Uncharacterized protein n=1 Tax=Aedes albopictus TaxID=7160 RepID=A0ABM1ZS79_AEDAL